METAIIVALTSSGVSGCLSVITAGITIYNQNRINRANQILEAKRKNQYYLEPLIRSAADLQSRIYNILKGDFIERYYYNENKRHQDYVINNTMFLFSQFFAWTEAARIDVQFLSLKNNKKTKKLIELQDNIYSIIQTDKMGPRFVFFAGEQRAIGEKMLKKSVGGYECIGYGEFINSDMLKNDTLFNELRKEVINMTKTISSYSLRLQTIQHALIELIDFLDPKKIKINDKIRTRI